MPFCKETIHCVLSVVAKVLGGVCLLLFPSIKVKEKGVEFLLLFSTEQSSKANPMSFNCEGWAVISLCEYSLGIFFSYDSIMFYAHLFFPVELLPLSYVVNSQSCAVSDTSFCSKKHLTCEDCI